MSETFNVLYENYVDQKNLDIILAFKDGQIKAHRLILSLSSPRFENILRNYEPCQKYLFFDHTSKDIMTYLLEFMYKGEVAIPEKILARVLEAAENFQVKGMQEACIVENVSSTNCSSDKEMMLETTSSSSYSVIRKDRLPNEKLAAGSSKRRLPIINEDNSKGGLSDPEDPDDILRVSSTANPVINPAAIRSSPNKSKQSTSNDSTTIPKTTKANTSKEPNKTAKLTDEQIDSLVNKYVVADDTQMSIDLCAGMSKNANDARLDQFGSSDDEPLSNLKKEIVPKKRKRGAELVGQRKMKKYEELLLNKSLLKNNEFCVICFKYIPKIGQHIKQCHRRMPKDKIECKRCKKSFYYSSFLAVHKCIKE